MTTAPRTPRICRRQLVWCLALALPLGSAVLPVNAQTVALKPAPPTLTNVQGRVETAAADGTWRAQTTAAELTTRLRTGTGRAAVQTGRAGQLVVGSASELRRYLDEADLLSGRFFLRGPVAVHIQGHHAVMTGNGQLRVDLIARQRRVAVIGGTLRIALNGQTLTLGAGQQIALDSGRITPFRETDAWYAAQFRGEGLASVEATRGPVTLRGRGGSRLAVVGDALQAGAALNTGAEAWAEIGFTGGGYLRLNAQSELSVVSIERTAAGREVLLRLERGTAWNVVQKGQGGYRIDTPVVSTAVRGTVFRVDAAGLVKVFDGQVALPGNTEQGSAEQVIAQGQQRPPSGPVAPLQPDALDRFNLAQDAQRATPLALALELPGDSLQELALAARSLPDAQVTLTVAGQTIPLSGQEGVFRLERLNTALPEGPYTVRVRAQRYGRTLERTQTITIDRTPPRLSGLQVQRAGRILSVSGVVTDADPQVTLSVTVGQQTYTRTVDSRTGQPFHWNLPLGDPQAPATLTLRDRADNRSHAQLP